MMNLIFSIASTALLVIQCAVCLFLCALSLSNAQGNSDLRAFSAFAMLAMLDIGTLYFIWVWPTANSPAIGLLIFVVLASVMAIMYRALTRS